MPEPDAQHPSCELCQSSGGELLWQDDFCRVVRVSDADYPGFCRVILHKHHQEMSDLPSAERQRLMDVVFSVESVVRELFVPDKVNLASLGNMVPHLHWHVIPRWRDDRHFPQPVWALPLREVSPERPSVSDERLAGSISERLGSSMLE